MSAFLEIKGITKSYDDEPVVRDLDLSVENGKVLSILGPSGCGKSTLLKMIAGLLEQDRGEVWIDGKRIDGLLPSKREIGFVFQNYSLFPHMDVTQNIDFGLRIRKVPEATRGRRVKELLGLIGLEGLGNRRPSQLSGGQQQRVALARALAVDPKILLLDEPFGALDAKIRKRLRRDLKDLQRELGVVMVFVTHDQDEAFELGDEIAVMNHGRIDQVGLPRNLYDYPATPFVAKFIGNVNVIQLPGENGDEGMEVMVRPEDVHIHKAAADQASGGVGGSLLNYVFLGPFIETSIVLDNKEYLNTILPKAEFIAKGLRRGDRLKVEIGRFRSFKNGGVVPPEVD